MRTFASIALLVSLGCVGCVEPAAPRAGEFSEGDIAVASFALSSIPPQVRCVRIYHRATTTGLAGVVASTTIAAGRASVVLSASDLPLGQAYFFAYAYNVDCSAITADVANTWQSDVVSTQLRLDRIPDVALTLHPIRSVELEANFKHDFEAVHQCGLAMIGVESRGALRSTGITEVAAPPLSLLGATGADIGCGPYFGCIALANAPVSCWGLNLRTFPGSAETMTATAVGTLRVKSVDVGEVVACAIALDGNVQCWGNNVDGLLVPNAPSSVYMAPVTPHGITINPPELTWQQVAVGTTSACALASNGTIRCWGTNAFFELGSSTARLSAVIQREGVTNGVIKLAASANGMYGLRANGQVAHWGDGLSVPALVGNLSDAIDIAAGDGSACALRANGDVMCWGRGESGQHGDGLGETNRTAPTSRVVFKPGWEAVVALSGDEASYCALHAYGTVSCWGDNGGGNLGDGTTNIAFEPVLAERWDTRIDYPSVPTR